MPFYARRERNLHRMAMGASFGVLVAATAYLGLWVFHLGPLVVMGGWAPASAVALFLASQAGRRSVHTALAIGITLGGLAGVGLYAISPPAVAAEVPPVQRELEHQANFIQQELALYAQRPREPEDPAYPSNRGFTKFASQLKTTKDLPPVATVAGRPLYTAKELAHGAAPVALGTRTAQKPASLVYDHDDASDTYVLYAIGANGEVVGQARSVR